MRIGELRWLLQRSGMLGSVGGESAPAELADALWLAALRRADRPASPTVDDQPLLEDDLSKADDIGTEEVARESRLEGSPLSTVPKPETLLPAEPPPDLQVYATLPTTASPSPGALISAAVKPQLPEPLLLARAMRPLRRRVPSATRLVLDEEATADLRAEQRLWLPVLVPDNEPAFDLALVLDDTESMALWGEKAREFRLLCERLGAFRDVRTWRLGASGGDGQAKPVLRSLSRSSRTRDTRELIDPSGRRVILVVTDGVHPWWRPSGPLRPVLARWAVSSPLAIVQPLPQRLWDRSPLDLVTEEFRAGRPGCGPTIHRLGNAHTVGRGGRGSVAVPILELSPAAMRRWAGIISGTTGLTPLPATALPWESTAEQEPKASVRADGDRSQADPAQLVRDFRASVSPAAYQLAGYLSAAPLTLPVMRLVQESMMPEAGPAELAEVFLSGLLRRSADTSPTVDNLESAFYKFASGVRDVLQSTLTKGEALSVLDQVGGYLTQGQRGGRSFPVALGTEATRNDIAAVAFGRISDKLLGRISGTTTLTQLQTESREAPRELRGDPTTAERFHSKKYLSRPVDQMQDHYSVVVVGSGYGGAIAADRMARAGRDVCVLERGREIRPGEYPNSARSAARNIQVHTSKADHGSSVGMFDFHVGPDVTVLSGCGLGGTSLIDAGVALEPTDATFSDERWPAPLRDHLEVLRPFMHAVREMLGSTPYPRTWPELPKLRALEMAAASLGREVVRPDLNVTFTSGPNAVGVRQNSCTLCGDCCSGCNYGAKNTLLMNYLPDAHAHGAHIFTEVAVHSVRRWHGKWRVGVDVLLGRDERDPSELPRFVTADIVVLSAGTIGSTQILLRSRELGLPLSGRLGDGFSANGDVLSFAYDTDTSAGVGLSGRVPGRDPVVGPAIAGLIDLRGPDTTRENALLIEDSAIPGALASVIPLVLGAASDRPPGEGPRRLRELAGIPFGSHRGPVGRLRTYLMMSTDDAGGRIILENDRIQVVWPEIGEQRAFARDNGALAAVAPALHGTETSDPLWAWTNGESVITVNPLGGCAMADDETKGVVDHKGRVFDPVSGGVHDGLYVCDGSVIPCALDANPLLTISAIAERMAAMVIEERGWEALQEAEERAPVSASNKIRLEFTERLTGFVSMRVHDDYAEGYDRGRIDNAHVDLLITVEYNDFKAALDDPTHEARISGTMFAPQLSPHRLAVTKGSFTLLYHDPSRVETWHMRYQMTLRSEDGKRFLFEGHKVLSENGALRAGSETTTLYTKIGEPGRQQPGTGILSLKPNDLAKLLHSIKIRGVPRPEQDQYRRAFLELFPHEIADNDDGAISEPDAP